MEFKTILSLLFIAHLLGDFYFQSDKLAIEKNIKWHKMALHGFIYTLCIIALINLFFENASLLFPLLLAAIHLLIDVLKRLFLRYRRTKKHPIRLFFTDQVVHFVTILVIAWFYASTQHIALSTLSTTLHEIYSNLFVNIPAYQAIHLICVLLFVWKPSAMITAMVLETVRYKQQPKQSIDVSENNVSIEQKKNAGRYIGILERLLTVIFIIMGQYTAIAFTLTAKSVARFKELENADFAEQYLIGTLMSQLLAIVSTVIFVL